MRYLAYRILLILLVISSVHSQEIGKRKIEYGTISGRVVEAKSRKPIIGANVILRGTMLGAATDIKGNFIISQIFPSTYTIMVTAIGYKSEEKTVVLLPGQKINLSFSLKETVILMDGIAVTASRYQQSLEDVPVSLNLVPARELNERNISSLDQALRYVPGVNALDGGQITIRGSSGFNQGMGSRVLVLINGQPFMTGDNWSINWYAIPTSNIKQIEVMKGSGSALYGSSAMGGVINIITKEPPEGSHIDVRTFTGFYNHSSYPQWEWTNKRHHFEGTAVDFSTHIAGVAAFFSSNYRTTTGYKEDDDQQIFNFMAKLSYNLAHDLRFDLMTGYGNDKGGYFLYWKNLQHPYENGSDPYGYRTRSRLKNTYVFPSLSYVLNSRVYLAVKGRFNNSTTEDRLQSKFGKTPEQSGPFRASTVHTRGAEIQLNTQVTSHGIMVMGGDFQSDEVESIQYGHRRVSKASYYFQLEQKLWKKLKITLGARYDGENGEGINESGELSRKLGLNFNFPSGTNLRFSLGEGFRTPAIGERFVSTFTSGLHVAPNPDLRPERSVSGEIGIRQGISKSMKLDAAIFYSEYKDLIEPQLDTGPNNTVVVRFKNVVKARVQGIDLSQRTDWWSQLVSTRIGYTYIDSKDLSPGEYYGAPLKYRSKHMLYITNDITFHPIRLGIDFRYLSKIQRIDIYHKAYIPDIDKLVPTYVVSLRFGVSGKHSSLRFLVDNLFQYNYLTSPANMGPPRTAVLQLNVRY